MLYFKKNLPVWERALRLCLAIFMGIGTFYFSVQGIFQILLLIFAATFAGTAFIGFCPACAILGRKSVESKK